MRNANRLLLSLILVALVVPVGLSFSLNQQRSPSDTVREFYKAMREKRFREAFALSIYKPVIDGLSRPGVSVAAALNSKTLATASLPH